MRPRGRPALSSTGSNEPVVVATCQALLLLTGAIGARSCEAPVRVMICTMRKRMGRGVLVATTVGAAIAVMLWAVSRPRGEGPAIGAAQWDHDPIGRDDLAG